MKKAKASGLEGVVAALTALSHVDGEKGELIIAKLTPKGYEEIDRAAIVAPTNKDAGRKTVWVHPAFAGKKMYVRNDLELVCVDLAK